MKKRVFAIVITLLLTLGLLTPLSAGGLSGPKPPEGGQRKVQQKRQVPTTPKLLLVSLDHVVGVQVPASQPFDSPASSARSWRAVPVENGPELVEGPNQSLLQQALTAPCDSGPGSRVETTLSGAVSTSSSR